MKKKLLYGALAMVAMAFTGCNDFLDENRYPLDAQTNNAEFWNTASNVDGQVYAFYNNFIGYGNGTGSGWSSRICGKESTEAFSPDPRSRT